MTVNRAKSSHVMKNFVEDRFLDIRFVTGSVRCLRMSRHKDAIIYSMGLEPFCGGYGLICGPYVDNNNKWYTWLPKLYVKFMQYIHSLGHAVVRLVEVLSYKSEGRGFDSSWFHWNSSLT